MVYHPGVILKKHFVKEFLQLFISINVIPNMCSFLAYFLISAVDELKHMLKSAGFQELRETEHWELEQSKKVCLLASSAHCVSFSQKFWVSITKRDVEIQKSVSLRFWHLFHLVPIYCF